MTCPVCATPAVPTARFCFHCGAPLEAALGEGEAERRVVTVLFGDLSDFTSWAEDLDPERVGVVTDRVLAALAEAVTEFGGHVDKLTGDGIMAVFGAPTAHEDDAERAVRAAAAMQREVQRLVEQEQGGGRRLGLRVGLNTGEVLAGVQASLSYTVVGDTVNTASRLSDVARVGSVFAGRETAAATMHAASWRALAPMRLKGKRDPVAVYELVGLHGAARVRVGLGDDAPTIGRDAEMGLLVGRVLDTVEAASPATVVLTGEAGVGKTRLVADLARFVEELPGARVLWGRCLPYGEGRDLAPVAALVRTACGVGEGDPPAEALARVRRTAARLEHPAYAGFVPSALGDRLAELLGLAPTPEGPRGTATPGPPAQASSVEDAVVSLFTALATEGPLLLVVDDLHLAGPGLRGVLGRVASRLSGPVLLAALGRPELLQQGGPWWEAYPEPELVPLLPLEEAAAERLLRAYLGGTHSDGAGLDDAARSLLLGRAQGNPFFLAELLRLLVDRGVLRREQDRWVLAAELPPDVLPAGVQAVLAARIDSLEPPARAVLRDAAVLGPRFPTATLAALGQRDQASLAAALAELEERGMIRPDGPGWYVFNHTLARDVAYAGIPKADRARRHAQAAGVAWPGTDPGGEADAAVAAQAERALELASEMDLPAGDLAWTARGPGFAAAVRLGQAALDRDDYSAAQAALARALRLGGSCAPAELMVPARLAHAEALAGLRRLSEAQAELAPALDSPAPGLRAGALVVLGDIRRKRGDDARARAAFVSAVAAASDAGLDRVTGEAIRQLGLLDYLTGRLRSAESRFRQALDLARRVGDQRGAGWALQHLAWSATTRADYALAERALAEAGEVFAGLTDTGGLSWCAGTEALVRVLQGRLTDARAIAGGLLALAESTGQRWEVAACLTIDALGAAELGEVGVAAAEAERAAARFAEAGDGWGLALALAAAGLAARGAGDVGAAVGFLSRAEQVALGGRHTAVASLATVALGLAHLEAGEVPAAAQAAARVEAGLAGLDLEPAGLVGPRVLRAQVLRAQGRPAEALEVLEGVLGKVSGPSMLFPHRQALAHLAGTLVELGRAQEGLEVARRALTVPGEDVRSRVVALRVLAGALAALGRTGEARQALDEAWAAAVATEQVSERAATRRALAALGADQR